mmetsp:Transcript_54434/g.125431  ORF Transcript_54434/g.125431 Transcript_54434/m.125431 type:complete len:220 (-) Transcript_54434:131-790(-)
MSGGLEQKLPAKRRSRGTISSPHRRSSAATCRATSTGERHASSLRSMSMKRCSTLSLYSCGCPSARTRRHHYRDDPLFLDCSRYHSTAAQQAPPCGACGRMCTAQASLRRRRGPSVRHRTQSSGTAPPLPPRPQRPRAPQPRRRAPPLDIATTSWPTRAALPRLQSAWRCWSAWRRWSAFALSPLCDNQARPRVAITGACSSAAAPRSPSRSVSSAQVH